jgi:hypothetical protein
VIQIKRLIVSFEENGELPSNPIQLGGIGHDLLLLQRRSLRDSSLTPSKNQNNSSKCMQLYEFTVQTRIECVEAERLLYTKFVSLAPRYVIVNNCAAELLVT